MDKEEIERIVHAIDPDIICRVRDYENKLVLTGHDRTGKRHTIDFALDEIDQPNLETLARSFKQSD